MVLGIASVLFDVFEYSIIKIFSTLLTTLKIKCIYELVVFKPQRRGEIRVSLPSGRQEVIGYNGIAGNGNFLMPTTVYQPDKLTV